MERTLVHNITNKSLAKFKSFKHAQKVFSARKTPFTNDCTQNGYTARKSFFKYTMWF